MSRRIRLPHLALAAIGFAGGWWASGLGPTPHDHAPEVRRLRAQVTTLREAVAAADRGRARWERRDSLQRAHIEQLSARVDSARSTARSASGRLARLLDSLHAPAHVLATATALAGACETGLATCDSIRAVDSLRIEGRDSIIRVLVPQRDSALRLADTGAELSAAIERQRAAAVRQRNAALVATVIVLILGALK